MTKDHGNNYLILCYLAVMDLCYALAQAHNEMVLAHNEAIILYLVKHEYIICA